MSGAYKMKHRLPPIDRLCKYKTLPPPMTGNPPGSWRNWEERCIAVYEWMIAIKRGKQRPTVIPERERRGLWFHAP